jgi:hypothetical protein
VSTQEGVAEVNETWLGHIAIGVRVATVLLCVTTMVTKRALLQKLATMGDMPALVAPAASIRDSLIISNMRLTDEPLALQDF